MRRNLWLAVIIICLVAGASYVLWLESRPTQQVEDGEIARLRLEIDGLRQEYGVLLEQRGQLVEQLELARRRGRELNEQLR